MSDKSPVPVVACLVFGFVQLHVDRICFRHRPWSLKSLSLSLSSSSSSSSSSSYLSVAILAQAILAQVLAQTLRLKQ